MELKSPKSLLISILLLGTFYSGTAHLLEDYSNFAQYENSCSGIIRDLIAAAKGFSNLVFYEPVKVHQVLPLFSKVYLTNPNFDAKKNVTVFISGWNTTKTEDLQNKMADAYACRGEHNYIYFNTGTYYTKPYLQAVSATEELGEALALALKELGTEPDKIHLIGHGLGAHVAGSAGRLYQGIMGQKIARITALDPARPCFRKPAKFAALSKCDAKFVDVVHTNPGRLGDDEAIGHADYYAGNLEDFQPGCSDNVCSQTRALEFYLETISENNEKNIMATQCQNVADLKSQDCFGPRSPVGFAADKKARGIYAFSVNAKSPYGLVTARSSGGNKCTACKTRWDPFNSVVYASW